MVGGWVDRSRCAAGCDAGWIEHDGACFRYVNESKHGNDAEAHCRNLHSLAHLATIGTVEQNALVDALAAL